MVIILLIFKVSAAEVEPTTTYTVVDAVVTETELYEFSITKRVNKRTEIRRRKVNDN